MANAPTMNNSTIIKCIEHCNYMSNNFVNYNQKTLTDICRYIKITINYINRYKVYKECKNTSNCPCVYKWRTHSILLIQTVFVKIKIMVMITILLSELLQNDNVSFECTNASPDVDFIRTKKDPL